MLSLVPVPDKPKTTLPCISSDEQSSKGRWLTRVLPLLVLLLPLLSACGQRGQPARDGILNFGKINEVVFRGAQPDAAGIEALKKLGVKMIINLRTPDDLWKEEENQARCNGILYTNIPLKGLGRPKDADIQTILTLLETCSAPVFVHCQHGCDRTGTIIACYRIHHDHWSCDSALEEARKYGLSRLERGMKRFVVDFGRTTAQTGDQAAAKKL